MKQQCTLGKRATKLWVHRVGNDSNINGNNRNLNNSNTVRGMASTGDTMNSCENLWEEMTSFENLFLAWKKARKHKTKKDYVIEFEKDLLNNLFILQQELKHKTYYPKPLKTFIIRDPKTRKISKSDFRDRIVHHVLCKIIEPIFEKTFIYDSYANRTGKGTLKAIERFDYFKRKASRNNTRNCFVLKADIKHYFETVSHKILISILERKIKDKEIIHIIKIILDNYQSKEKGKGMPLGNLTSQFFANIYLNELDQFVKHKLKIRYYIRYVDDFVIFEKNKEALEKCKKEINTFLKTIDLQLHKGKSKIKCLNQGIAFLGFRIFYYHKLLKKSNIIAMAKKLHNFQKDFIRNKISYDKIYECFEGWLAYAKQADAYNLRKRFIKEIEKNFPNEISAKEINGLVKYLADLN